MAWYRSGTVTVANGSKNVTGAGTAFVASVEKGEGFLGPDGRVYEVADIASNTALTLVSNYQGAGASGQNYAILPTQSALADLAANAAEMLNSFAAVRDNAGQGKFAYGSAAAPGMRFIGDEDVGFYRSAANTISISIGGSEAWRFDSARKLLALGSGSAVDATASSYSLRLDNDAMAIGTNASGAKVQSFNRPLELNPAGNPVRILAGRFVVDTGSVAGRPGADNTYSIGEAAFRFTQLFAASGTINTSDERDKTWRGEMSANEYAAGSRIIDELGFFQWNDAVEEKGAGNARLHFGVRAQAVWTIMQEAGLAGEGGEAIKYGFLCYDEWEDRMRTGEDGEPVLEREAGNRYGIRPDQLALFLIAVQARRQAELTARIAALEAG